jgi:hypothetical protein
VVTIHQLRAEGLVEAGEVFVEGKEPQKAWGGLAIGLGL